MSESEENSNFAEPAFHRVSNWISTHDFRPHDEQGVETNLVDGITDITSVTKNIERKRSSPQADGLVVEERTDVVKCGDSPEAKDDNFIKTLTKFSQYSPFDKRRNRTSSPSHFSVIVEGEELELPEVKKSETSFKSVKYNNLYQQPPQQPIPAYQPAPRPSSRHKRHAEPVPVNRQSLDRKTRKRRTLEKIGASVEERQKILEEIAANRVDRQNKRRQHRRLQTEQFVKSMQMLQANAPDSQPFEDYSLFVYRQTAPNFEDRVKDLEKKFTYVPDHENKLPNQTRGNTDEDFAARIRNIEDRCKEPQPAEKKPRDLLRAIGKIETSDWNIKEIEKKIMENKLGKAGSKDKEKVPKWSKEQFRARQTKMEKQHLERQDSAEAKFADIDKSIKHLDLKLKEGTVRELGQNKVASITEKLTSKVPDTEPKPIQKSNSRPVMLPSQNASEFCHFCGKRVYLMERLSAEGRFFHHGCFKCQYCNTQLRLGSYAFDRDGIYDHKFFCIHHYGMQGEIRTKIARKPSQRQTKSPEKKPLSGIAGVDLLDRVTTPERVEFANLNTAHTSDHEESLSQMDEDEWTDKNFGASAAELGSSDDESSSLSDTDSDDEDAFEEALEEPATKEGTLKWAERFNRRYSKKRNESDSGGYSSSDRSSYYENSSDDEDSDTATEGEEEIRARELRKQEVRVEPPVVQTDTGTDTEVKSPNLPPPDILSGNLLRVPDPKSEDDSADYNSAVSGCSEDENKKAKTSFALSRSATAGALPPPKPVRNFVLPPKTQRKSFGAEFVPKFAVPEPEPLLIIKRTPSKLNVPIEIGKPKVALSANFEQAKKYFGTPVSRKPAVKPILKRSETATSVPRNRLVKQTSLPEKPKEEKKVEVKFNFDPLEDTKEVDSYIENLLANEDELMKPIDLSKYKAQESEESEREEKGEEPLSSSIEDLFKALKTETKREGDLVVDRQIDEKIGDLLDWMDDLEHQSHERKTYRSLSDAKYKNLERSLKVPRRADSVISRIPKDNITYFERHLQGKKVEEDEPPRAYALARSKTDIYCNKPRSSVDLDAVSKVDIKKVLMKFEQAGQEDEKEKEKVVPKRRFGKRFSLTNLKQRENERRHSENFESALKDFENFVDNMRDKKEEKEEKKDWCVNITVSTIPNPEYLGLGIGSGINFDGGDLDAIGVGLEEIDTTLGTKEEVLAGDEKSAPQKDTKTENVEPKGKEDETVVKVEEEEDKNTGKIKPESSTSSSGSLETDSDDESEIDEAFKQITEGIESIKGIIERIEPKDQTLEKSEDKHEGPSEEESEDDETDTSSSDEESESEECSEDETEDTEPKKDTVESKDAVESKTVNLDLNKEIESRGNFKEKSGDQESKIQTSKDVELVKENTELNLLKREAPIPKEMPTNIDIDMNKKESPPKVSEATTTPQATNVGNMTISSSKTEPKQSSKISMNIEMKKKEDTESSSKKTETPTSQVLNVGKPETPLMNITISSSKREPKHSSPDYATIEDVNKLLTKSTEKEESVVKKPVNLEDLYAKVNKPPREKSPLPQQSTSSPPVPRRNRKKSVEEPPPRPQRQKSHEQPKTPTEPNNNEEFFPIAPQRKRANTASPLPKHKTALAPPPDDGKSRSTTNLEVKKEIVRLKDLPRLQNASRARTLDSKSKNNKNKDKDKDCNLQ